MISGHYFLTGLSVVLSLTYAAGAAVALRHGSFRDLDSHVIENDLIRVVVVPKYDGRIVEYSDRKTGGNYFLSPEMETLPYQPVPGLVIPIRTNYGGLKDWFWETQVIRSIRWYRSEILKNSPEEVRIKVTYDATRSGYRVERCIALRPRTTVMDIETIVTNIGKESRTLSYWMHNLLAPDGTYDQPADYLLVPQAAGERNVRNLTGKTNVTSDSLIYQPVPRTGTHSYVPAQGWFGMVDTIRKKAIVQLMSLEDIQPDGFVSYCYCAPGPFFYKSTATTQEIVFGSRHPVPGHSMVYRTSFALFSGLDRLDYADRNIAFKGEREPAEGGCCKVRLQAASAGFEGALKLNVCLQDARERRGPSRTVVMSGLKAGGTASLVLELPVPAPADTDLKIAVEILNDDLRRNVILWSNPTALN